jgi:4-amino-4-deoxy-L-arabinose transferase-like glycosyltransferase
MTALLPRRYPPLRERVLDQVRSRRRGPRPELLVVLAGGVLAAVALLWNIRSSPDTQYDEVVYTEAARQVAEGWNLTWTNSPMFGHPPLSFLTQAAWLRLLGMDDAPLTDAILAARVLTAVVAVFAILLLGLLAAYLMPAASRRRGLVLVGLVMVLAATDPVLLRYGRLALIEPIALLVGMLTLCLAIRLRSARPLLYVPVVGLATGLTLLTKEVTVFLLFTPVVHALLGRDRRRVAVTAGAFAWGVGLWLLFPLWAVALGQTSDFVDVKFATVQRLLGLLQITGWNRPGVSFVSAVTDQLGQYASSYLFLAGGALTLTWLLTRALSGAPRWLLAWLLTSYAFGAYMVVLGTLNEQFFVYILPAAIVGTVLAADAALVRLGGPGVVTGLAAVVAVLGLSLGGWVRYYASANDGVFEVADLVRGSLPPCATLATTGDPDKLSYLLPGQTVTMFATAEGAEAHGVHLFVLSDKDVSAGYGTATPELLASVRARGELLGRFRSATFRGLEVRRTPVDPYAPLADTERIAGTTFVLTDGDRCGGFAVGEPFGSGWAALGGKAVVGAPVTGPWSDPDRGYQAFTGAVLTAGPDGRVSALPVVPTVARAEAAAWTAAGLPPVTARPGDDPTDAQVLTALTDPAIATAYLQAPAGPAAVPAARERLGAPVGPPTEIGGTVRQAFAGGVLERTATGVRLAPLSRLLLDAGVVRPGTAARTPVAAPPLSPDLVRPLPTSVQPFVTALLAGLALYVAVPVLAVEVVRLVRRRRSPR